MVNLKLVKRGISTFIAALLLMVLAVSVGVVIYTWRAQRFHGFMLSGYPPAVYSGEVFSVTVTAVDQYGNSFTSYTGSVYFTSTDTNVVIPKQGTQGNPYKFTGGDNGVHAFDGFRLISVKSSTITVTDGSESKTSNSITVRSSPILDHFKFSPISNPQIAGVDFGITLTAVDQYGNTLASYSGTPMLTYSAGSISPTTVTLSGGVGKAIVRVTAAGTGVTISTNDALVTGISNPFDVNPAGASILLVDAPGTVDAGTPFTVTVTAKDQFGNTVMGYLGTVHFSSNDGAATLPGDYTFVAGDKGVHMFTNGVTLRTAKTWTIKATDTSTPSITGSDTGVLVTVSPPIYAGYLDSYEDYSGNLIFRYPEKILFPDWSQAGDLFLMQVVVGDTYSTPSTPAGFTLLYGPDQAGTIRQWIYYKFAVGNEAGELKVFISGSGSRKAWMTLFRNVALTNFTEDGGFGSGNSSTILAQSVTVSGSNRLAVSFIFVSDDDIFVSYDGYSQQFSGESGGDWKNNGYSILWTSKPIQHLTLWMQTATIAGAGTISGGSYTMVDSESWGVRAFALLPR